MTRSADTTTAGATDRSSGAATTSGVIALINLHAQIASQCEKSAAQQLSTAQTAELIELIALRGRLLSRISDYETAQRCADRLCEANPYDGTALLARARCRARFHRFTEALDDLDHAQRLGADPADVAAERASVLQALGRLDEAAATLNSIKRCRSEFEFHASLASLAAARAGPTVAEQLFETAAHCYRGVSPIPLADLEHQRGHMWLSHGDGQQAAMWLQAAHRRMPYHAQALGHLAEAEALRGRTQVAIDLLQPLAQDAEDPTYAATLASLLHKAGRRSDADRWRTDAARRYTQLIARHPEAFGHHAAETLAGC